MGEGMASGSKFLVDFLHSINERTLFFIGWFVIAGGFTALMLAFQKKANRRNFKEDANQPANRGLTKKN